MVKKGKDDFIWIGHELTRELMNENRFGRISYV